MKRPILLLTVLALALPVAAHAKGPSQAKIEGPGLDRAVVLGGSGESAGTPLGDLTEQVGFFPAAFGQSPDPMLHGRPHASLGPKYTVVYTVPSGPATASRIRQDLYPYAKPSPVTYMPSGQPIFGEKTRGGWYRSEPELKAILLAAGLPRRAPTSSGGLSAAGLGLTLAGAALLAAATAAVVFVRRRARPPSA